MHPLRSALPLIVYIDIKSPYAFMALDPTFRLEDDFDIEIDWRPLTLNIGSFLGTARTDNSGRVVESRRSEEQWRWVRQAYHDVKRTARYRGRTLLGPRKIWDSSLAAIGMTWARRAGRSCLKRYLETVYDRFWQRDLDIEDAAVITAMLREAGAPVTGFADYLAGEGRAAHDDLQASLLPAGIFGVPTYVVAGEPFFGREHLPMVRWHLAGRQGPMPDVAYDPPPCN